MLYCALNNYKVWQRKYSLWEWYLQKKSFKKVIANLSIHDIRHSNQSVILSNIKSKKVEVKSSPYWIKKRLELMDFKPVNNIIDTINIKTTSIVVIPCNIFWPPGSNIFWPLGNKIFWPLGSNIFWASR